jgi:DNA-binding transcriptional ArsR family regulator
MSKNLDQAVKALLAQIEHYENGAAYYTECAARAKEALQQIQSIRNYEDVAQRQDTDIALKLMKKGLHVSLSTLSTEIDAIERTPRSANKVGKVAVPNKNSEAAAKEIKAGVERRFPMTNEVFWLNILAGGHSFNTAQLRDTAVAKIEEQGASLTQADLKKLESRMGSHLAKLRKKNIITAELSGNRNTKLYSLVKPSLAGLSQSTAA